jgi:hypothetical protein
MSLFVCQSELDVGCGRSVGLWRLWSSMVVVVVSDLMVVMVVVVVV